MTRARSFLLRLTDNERRLLDALRRKLGAASMADILRMGLHRWAEELNINPEDGKPHDDPKLKLKDGNHGHGE